MQRAHRYDNTGLVCCVPLQLITFLCDNSNSSGKTCESNSTAPCSVKQKFSVRVKCSLDTLGPALGGSSSLLLSLLSPKFLSLHRQSPETTTKLSGAHKCFCVRVATSRLLGKRKTFVVCHSHRRPEMKLSLSLVKLVELAGQA